MDLDKLKKFFKIAVVDDSDFSRKEIVNLLEAEGFGIAGEAMSAQKALEIAAATEVHLWIIDVVMPEVSGIELAKNLLDLPGQKLIIMVSSLHTESVVIDAISNGANDFIKKPFENYDLLVSVEKMLKFAKSEKMI